MNQKIRNLFGYFILTIVAVLSVFSVLFLSGCDKTLDGDLRANSLPLVEFVNIPPGPVVVTDTLYPGTDSSDVVVDTTYTRFSRNPYIYWYGTDVDGQIEYYRYTVVTEIELAGSTPEEHMTVIAADSSGWIYLDVVPTKADPHTTEIIKLRALTEDPINTYLVQYVFLQAFDDNSEGSDIVYRAFSRNDSPPVTSIAYFDPNKSFINSKTAGIITGVSMRWGAVDPDYPGGLNAPPFDFEWRMYGPYIDYDADNDDSVFVRFLEKYEIDAFFGSNGKLYVPGDTLIECDVNSGFCDTFVIGEDDMSSADGNKTRILDVDQIELDNDTTMNKLAYSSNGWTNDSNIVLYDVYKNHQPPDGGDTTVEMNFAFWVKSRDDALVEDLVPSYRTFRVIDPRFERPVMVVDFNQFFGTVNTPKSGAGDSAFYLARNFWKSVVNHWGEKEFANWTDTTFNTNLNEKRSMAPDYMFAAKFSSGIPVVELLKHKIVIIYNDGVKPPDNRELQYSFIYDAIDAGVNVWLIMRTPLNGGLGSEPIFGESRVQWISNNYKKFFAVTSFNYSAWQFQSYYDSVRVEDFVMAKSGADLGGWPNIPIDTALLHANYIWNADLGCGWDGSVAALPEVNWTSFSQRYTSDGVLITAEPIYLYGSKYGQGGHPLGGPLANYDGSPVAHLVTGEYFKTAYFSFTPLALQPDSFMIAADRVLNFLYEPDPVEPASKNTFSGSR